MLADPQTVTVNSVAQSMARILSEGSAGNLRTTYQKSDQTFTLTVSQQRVNKRGKNRINCMVRLDQRALVTNPLDSTNDYDTQSFWFVYERPEYGFDQTAGFNLASGLKTWLDSTAFGKLYGGES